jgi:predicted lipid-binding transport protein (Tim44 family)
LLPVWSQFIVAAGFDTMADWRSDMKKLLLVLGLAVLGGAMVVEDVEARRLGAGRSTGVQRNVTAPPAQTPARPAQQQAAPAGQQQNAAPAAAASQNRWLPMLGGLALGGLLGYLFAGNGLLGILVVALLAVGIALAVRALMRRRTAEAPRPMQLAGFGRDMAAAPPPAQASAPQRAAVPAGFDSAGFLRAAKLNFVKLQMANDSGRLDEIREFTTPELFEDLRREVVERGAAAQHTDVARLDADLLEVATQGGSHWASVRFSGTVRESPGTAAEGFEEVWNLVKPVDGSSGWLLAGIQQMH